MQIKLLVGNIKKFVIIRVIRGKISFTQDFIANYEEISQRFDRRQILAASQRP
jgi:hypothetical protein